MNYKQHPTEHRLDGGDLLLHPGAEAAVAAMRTAAACAAADAEIVALAALLHESMSAYSMTLGKGEAGYLDQEFRDLPPTSRAAQRRLRLAQCLWRAGLRLPRR
jgi:hypothetical protein